MGSRHARRRFPGLVARSAAAVLVALAGVAVAETPAAAPLTPEQTVTAYLQALKANDFPAVYDRISRGMAGGKSRDAWVKETQWTAQMSESRILHFKVLPGKLEGDKARVPNLLHAQDKFLNQLGLPEHELYTLVREDGVWKVDQQRLLERSEQGAWFPAAPPPK